jgi:hypothetical protein
MYAKQSMLTSIFDKWGKFIGANTLKHLAVRNLGGTAEIYPGAFNAGRLLCAHDLAGINLLI